MRAFGNFGRNEGERESGGVGKKKEVERCGEGWRRRRDRDMGKFCLNRERERQTQRNYVYDDGCGGNAMAPRRDTTQHNTTQHKDKAFTSTKRRKGKNKQGKRERITQITEPPFLCHF